MEMSLEQMGPDYIMRLVARLNFGKVEIVEHGLHVRYYYDKTIDTIRTEEWWPRATDCSRKIYTNVNPMRLITPKGFSYNPDTECLEGDWDRCDGRHSRMYIHVYRRYKEEEPPKQE